jgi:DNA-binding Xre family transcriptional regulator
VAIRWRVRELLDRAGRSRHWLVRATGLPATTIYRVAEKGTEPQKIDANVLERLCLALEVIPGELLELVPAKRRKRG